MKICNLITEYQQTIENKANLYVVTDTDSTSQLGMKIYCQIFLHKRLEIKRLFGFLDSGADLSICQESYLLKLFSAYEIAKFPKKKLNYELTSYSNDKISLSYSIDVDISFTKYGEKIKLTLYIIPDIKGVPQLLFGADFMKRTLMNIAYVGNVEDPVPQIKVLKPEETLLTSFYTTENDLYSCTLETILKPYENKTCTLYLHPASPALESDYVLISGGDIDKNIYITPSRSQVSYDFKNKCLKATAFIHNISPFSNEIRFTCQYEILNDERLIPVTNENRHKLANYAVLFDVYPFKYNQVKHEIVLNDKIPDNQAECTQLSTNIYCLNHNKQNFPVDSPDSISSVELEKFYSKEHTAIAEPDFKDDGELDPDISLPKGHSVADDYLKRPQDIVDLTKFDDVQRPYVKDIFLDTYPQVLARGALDAGNLSNTLGYYHLQLKDNQVLPKFKKVFFLNPEETQHLKDILSFLLKNNVITRAPMSGDPADLYGSPAYLIAKKSKNSSARLIVDYRHLNSLIKAEPSIIPDIPSILHSMRNSAMFSTTDLSCAYYSFKLTESSRYLTRFCTPVGCFNYVSLPTGVSISCMCFTTVANRMVHEKVVLDENGEPVYEKPNVVKMVPDPIPGTLIYFDDLLIHTPAQQTYADTVRVHYEKMKLVMSRLAFHNSKIGFEKSILGKSRIAWLGWLISNNFIMVNPKRIKKLQEAEFPQNVKGVRSFLGLLNSIRLTVQFKNFEQIRHLTPLTSSKTPFKPTEFHRKVFEELKNNLTKHPVFSQMICPRSRKLLFTDASSSSNSSYSCVLAQIIEPEQDEVYIPPFLTLDDPVHRIIYDKRLVYQPAPLIVSEKQAAEFHQELAHTKPPIHEYLDLPLLGFTTDNVTNSFFIAVQSVQAVYKCKVSPISEMRLAVVKHIKKTVLRMKLNDFVFNNNGKATREYLEQLLVDAPIDKDFIAIEALSYILFRPVIVISSLNEHKNNPIFHFNGNMEKPPIVVGAYACEQHTVFLPYYVNKATCYDLRQHKNRFEIVAFHTRALPKTKRGQHIFEQELFAILSSLEAMKRYIGHSEVTLLTDSRPLYLLYNKDVHASVVKVYRWSLKLSIDYPNLKLQYIPTNQNIADFLSKKFSILPGDLPRLALSKIHIDDLAQFLPEDKVFTVAEWASWVSENPGYLKICTKSEEDKKLLTASLQKTTANLEKHIKPFAIMENRLSHENVIAKQKLEHQDLYSRCLSSKDFIYKQNDTTYQIINAMLFEKTDTGPKILMPPSMVGLLLSYHHLCTGHGGLNKLKSSLSNYSFPNKPTIIYNFVSRCYACQLTNKTTKLEQIGVYPVPTYPYEVLSMDLAENLGKSGRNEHLLICTCGLSSSVILIPLKNKTADAVSHALLYNVLQFYRVRYLFSDNAPCFLDKKFISFLATLGIQKLTVSALHPAGKGLAESRVKLVKVLMKKMLASHDDYDWQGLPFIVSKILNSTKTGPLDLTPFQYIYGTQSEHASDPFLTDKLPKLHPVIQDHFSRIKENQENLRQLITETRNDIHEQKLQNNAKLNKNRIKKDIQKGDIVFCLDRKFTLGASRPLKTPFHPSPFLVLAVYPTTCLIRRLSDSYTQIYSKNDLKVYKKLDNAFLNLPSEVLEIVQGKATELDALQLQILQRHDSFNLPEGNILTDEQNTVFLEDKSDNLPLSPDSHLSPTADPNLNLSSDNKILDDISSTSLPPPVESDRIDTENTENLKTAVSPEYTGSSNVHTQNPQLSFENAPANGAAPDTVLHNTLNSKPLDDSSDDENDPDQTSPMTLRSGKTVSFQS